MPRRAEGDAVIVYTGGTFDLFHIGHVRLLQRCRGLAGDSIVVVSLNTDEFITAYKGRPPTIAYRDRCEVLAACRYVDRVVENVGGADSKPAIDDVRPDIIAVGSDWEGRDYHAQMSFTQEWLDERGIRLVYLPYTEGVSSSAIRANL